MLAVCDWPIDYGTEDGEPTCTPLAGEGPEVEALRAKMEAMAVEYLWRYSGRQFGLCEAVIRPCKQVETAGLSTYGGADGRRWTPALVGGQWLNFSCGLSHRDQCGCDAGSVLRFDGPVYDVTRVEIDGVVLAEAAYRVDNSRLLVRQDGGRWPFCQDLSAPLGEEGTWAITVQVGFPVPVGGQIAAGRLACELAKAAVGDKECGLPKRWTTITRQGVSISQTLDTFKDLDEGKTGIWLIDSWVSSVTKPDIGFSIASPDYSGFGRRSR